MIKFAQSNNLILFSGGLDSTLLLYLHLKQVKLTTYVLTINKTPGLVAPIAEPIVAWMRNRFGRDDIQHYILPSDRDISKDTILGLISPFRDQYPTPDCVYSATTLNPDNDYLREISSEPQRNIIQKGVSNLDGIPWYKPFTHLHKKDIVRIYRDEDITDLMWMTRSCEWTADIPTPDPGLGHCGQCWWCKERIWGLEP